MLLHAGKGNTNFLLFVPYSFHLPADALVFELLKHKSSCTDYHYKYVVTVYSAGNEAVECSTVMEEEQAIKPGPSRSSAAVTDGTNTTYGFNLHLKHI